MNLTPEQARKKLVEALRSGEYTQKDRALRVREGYCCLGVACDVYRKIEEPGEHWHPVKARGVWEFMGEAGSLPYKVMTWLGFATSGGNLEGKYGSLVDMNDSGKSFEYIADAIEAGEVKLKEAP